MIFVSSLPSTMAQRRLRASSKSQISETVIFYYKKVFASPGGRDSAITRPGSTSMLTLTDEIRTVLSSRQILPETKVESSGCGPPVGFEESVKTARFNDSKEVDWKKNGLKVGQLTMAFKQQ
ncbi:Uncharacterized protein Rs2_22313 [Raphanus sativus]|nr:Uncharacterized protein Rs2_22313 [Raphanus sativus]